MVFAGAITLPDEELLDRLSEQGSDSEVDCDGNLRDFIAPSDSNEESEEAESEEAESDDSDQEEDEVAPRRTRRGKRRRASSSAEPVAKMARKGLSHARTRRSGSSLQASGTATNQAKRGKLQVKQMPRRSRLKKLA